MVDVEAVLRAALGDDRVRVDGAITEDFAHDEALSALPVWPRAVVSPQSTMDVSAVLRLADEYRIPVTARGSGSGLSGAAIPSADGVVVAFSGMDRIIEVDEANHVAVVEPGVRLDQLDEALSPLGLVYPVRPGELSASIGGTINTNAAGMRAVKHGVTRHHVLGLEAVLASGRVIRTGGKIVKVSSGYDLTQLLVGSEGTLALVTEAHLRLQPRRTKAATILAPFLTLDQVTGSIPAILATGLQPLILEYLDLLTMMVIMARQGIDPGIPDDVRTTALAYLVIQLEGDDDDRLEQDTVRLGGLLVGELGAMDAYVLPSSVASDLIMAREHAFFAAKEADARDVIDVVVPRAALPDYVREVAAVAQEYSTGIVGCGHAGDGNVHMAVFEADDERREAIMHRLLAAGVAMGGAISGEHGIGRQKKRWFQEFEDPVKIDLMRAIKAAFDPNGILNPGVIFD